MQKLLLIRNDTILFLKRSLKSILLVRMIARFSFAILITCHKLLLDSGSKPVVGSSMNTTCSKLPSHIISSFFSQSTVEPWIEGQKFTYVGISDKRNCHSQPSFHASTVCTDKLVAHFLFRQIHHIQKRIYFLYVLL